jgi:hypothetical protein
VDNSVDETSKHIHDYASLRLALFVLNAFEKQGKVPLLASLPAHDRNQRGAETHA